jgi:hypothetical protein
MADVCFQPSWTLTAIPKFLKNLGSLLGFRLCFAVAGMSGMFGAAG